MTPRLVALILSFATLSFGPAALADHPTCGGHSHTLYTVATGSVSPGDDDWWVVSVPTLGAVVLTPHDGDADLEVMDEGCAVTWCRSAFGSVVPDECVLNAGTYRVRVYYYAGTFGNVDYTLEATNVAPIVIDDSS